MSGFDEGADPVNDIASGRPMPMLFAMTKMFDHAVDHVRSLPADVQDEIASWMLRLSGIRTEEAGIDPEHLAAVEEGLAEADRGEFATPEEIEEAFRQFER